MDLRAFRAATLMVAAGSLAVATAATAQDGSEPATAGEWMQWVPDPASLQMPALTSAEQPDDKDAYEHFFFHRADTDYATALTDLRDCDNMTRGLSRLPTEGRGYAPNYYNFSQYSVPNISVGAALGASIGAALILAVVADVERPGKIRSAYNFNMRRCMFFKGYERYALTEDLYDAFVFDAGDEELAEEERQKSIVRQALAAASGTPTGEELGL